MATRTSRTSFWQEHKKKIISGLVGLVIAVIGWYLRDVVFGHAPATSPPTMTVQQENVGDSNKNTQVAQQFNNTGDVKNEVVMGDKVVGDTASAALLRQLVKEINQLRKVLNKPVVSSHPIEPTKTPGQVASNPPPSIGVRFNYVYKSDRYKKLSDTMYFDRGSLFYLTFKNPSIQENMSFAQPFIQSLVMSQAKRLKFGELARIPLDSIDHLVVNKEETLRILGEFEKQDYLSRQNEGETFSLTLKGKDVIARFESAIARKTNKAN